MDWKKKMFDDEGKPREDLPPEAWFSYIVQEAGGIPKVAEKLGVSRQTIHASWHGKFPDRYVVAAEKEWGIPRELLAPHLYK